MIIDNGIPDEHVPPIFNDPTRFGFSLSGNKPIVETKIDASGLVENIS
jgi:hypothetical protein